MGATSLDLSQIKTDVLSAASTFRTLIGLGNVNNTADLDKPISTATQAALDGKLSLSGGTLTGPLVLPAGSKSAVSLRLGGTDVGTGLWGSAGGTTPGMGFAVNGVSFLQTGDSSDGLRLHSLWGLAWTSGAADGTVEQKIYRTSSTALGFFQSGALRAQIVNGEFTATNAIRLTDFNPSAPDISILRNATGPTLETRSAGGLRVRVADGSHSGSKINVQRWDSSDVTPTYIQHDYNGMTLYGCTSPVSILDCSNQGWRVRSSISTKFRNENNTAGGVVELGEVRSDRAGLLSHVSPQNNIVLYGGFSGYGIGFDGNGELGTVVNSNLRSRLGQHLGLGSAGQVRFNSAADTSGSWDTLVLRNATGPTLETRSAGGVRVRTLDGSAAAGLNVGTITLDNASGSPSISTYSNAGITINGMDGNPGALRTRDTILSTTGYIYWNARALMTSSANGVVHVQNYDQNDTLADQALAFGPATLAGNGVRLKRAMASTTLQIRNGNDSAAGALDCGAITASGVTVGDSANTVPTIRTSVSTTGLGFEGASGNSINFIHGGVRYYQATDSAFQISDSVPLRFRVLGSTTRGEIWGTSASQIDIRANSGLRIRTLDGSAPAALNCNHITAVGGGTFNDRVSLGNVLLGQGGTTPSTGTYAINVFGGFPIAFSNAGGAWDVAMFRNASGPTLDTWSAGGLRVRTADGSAAGALDCGAITASGTSTINSLPAGGGLVLVPSASHNAFYGLRLASSSAGTERAAFLIQPFSGEIMIGASNGGGYYPVIYSNGVARLTFGTSGSLTARYGSTVNDTVALSDVGTLAGQTNAEGTKWQLVTAAGADSLRLASTSFVGFNSTGNLNTGSIDASIRRNASGSTLDMWSAGGLRVRSADGSAAAPIDASSLTFGSGCRLQGDAGFASLSPTANRNFLLASGGVQLWNEGSFRSFLDWSTLGTIRFTDGSTGRVGLDALTYTSTKNDDSGITPGFGWVDNAGVIGMSQWAGQNRLYFVTRGARRVMLNDTAMYLENQLAIGASMSNGSNGVYLAKDINDTTLAQRNGVNPQTFRVYNTFTDASNYERLRLEWSSNSVKIGTEAAGTGSVRTLEFWAGTMAFFFGTGNVSFLRSLQSDTNNAVDVGATNRRFRTLMLGTSIDNLGFEQFTEMTPPTTPAANSCRIYAKDNGSGKTQLVVLMPDGVETVLATQT